MMLIRYILIYINVEYVRTVWYGIENIQYIGYHLWASLREEIRNSGTLTNVKQKIKSGRGST